MNPIDNPTAYDHLVIAGEPTPGVMTWTKEPERDGGWTVQAGKGADGATLEKDGAKPLECGVALYLFRDRRKGIDGFAAWDAYRPRLLVCDADGKEQALDVYHPLLEELGASSFIIKVRGGLVPDGKGGGSVKLTLLEHVASVKKRTGTGKPKGSKGGKKPSAFDVFDRADKVDPNAALKAELATLTAENNSL